MLEAILRSNPRSDFMYVVDTRPKVSLRGSIQVLHFCAVCSGGTCFPHCVSAAACPHSFKFGNITALPAPPQDHICETMSKTNRINVVSLSFQLNAIANRAAGKGYENEDNYSNIKFQFMGIENIHVMRNSQQKMLEGKLFYPSPRVTNYYHHPLP